ncbi:MAG TPA: HAMP domain-containing sensor histidine kinase [Stellaceae bacterium]|nr:HAMP domain-containing sensor histidine kinase [Stellaceae bacterium]
MHPAGKRPIENLPARSLPADREAALEARIAELEDELRARDDFLAIAAHELRNPMTPISAQIELLLAMVRHMPGAVPERIVQGLERLECSVDAYLRRATILLEVSRINSGNLSLDAAEVDLSALVRKVAVGTIPAAERAGCRVRLTVQEGISGMCDATAMEQILENLLSNAIRYGAGRPVEVAFASDGGVAQLSVRDQGIGISPSDQAQIFERFHRLDQKSAQGGFGVGLWITRQLVHAMRGEIAVSSAPGAGSTFTVTLPLLSGGKADG